MQAKMSFSSSSFFLYKTREQEGRTGLSAVGELVLVKAGRRWGNSEGG
jgi:hypothetical protein